MMEDRLSFVFHQLRRLLDSFGTTSQANEHTWVLQLVSLLISLICTEICNNINTDKFIGFYYWPLPLQWAL